ncbi:MAG TPA: GNAT family N-acetyltransferase [Xanthomonadaceae bacterium]|nr:GNAT family N-acetyltransferase [Xanthomonadaceae bacterium]
MTGAAARIRPLRRDDAAEAARLCGQLGYPVDAATMATRLAAVLERPATHAVFAAAGATDDGHLLGMVAIEWRLMIEAGEQAEIVAMVVDAVARRTGLGRHLIDAACAWARQRGAASVCVRSNMLRAEAHAFYPSLGFAHGKTQHVYVKPLSAAGM